MEIAKFAIYIAVPIAFTFYVVNPDNMLGFLRWRQYVKYPAESAQRPPTSSEEVKAAVEALKNKGK